MPIAPERQAELLQKLQAAKSQPAEATSGGLSDAQKSELLQKLQANTAPPDPGLLEKIGGGIAAFGRAIVKPLASTAIQLPRSFAAGVAGLAGNEKLAGELTKPVNVPFLGEVKALSTTPGDVERYGAQTPLQDVGQAASIASLLVGGKAAATGAEQFGKQALLQTVKQGAKEGATAGALGGFGSGAEKENATAGSIAESTLGGTVTGALAGGALPLASSAIRSAGEALSRPSAKAAAEAELLAKGAPEAGVATKMLDETGKVVKDKAAAEVVRQGVPEADVALIKSGSEVDKQKMLKMLDIREGQLTNKRITDRATDVVGDTFVQNVAKPIEQLNKEAGKKLSIEAQKLAGKKINPTEALTQFSDGLERSGVTVGKRGELNFKDSDFEGMKGAQQLLGNVWKRAMKIAKSGDALQAHRAKAYVDEIVSYGKQVEGLSGRAQNILKSFRHAIDATLDEDFPSYNKVNTQYAETIGALDRMGAAIGKNFELNKPFADAQAGVSMRRILSNTQSRAEILKMLDEMQGILVKHGKSSSEDIVTQANFADVLEKTLGSEAPTSFLGQGERFLNHAEQLGSVGADLARGNVVKGTIRAGKYVIDATRGVNQENRLKALRALLGQEAGHGAFGKMVVK